MNITCVHCGLEIHLTNKCTCPERKTGDWLPVPKNNEQDPPDGYEDVLKRMRESLDEEESPEGTK